MNLWKTQPNLWKTQVWQLRSPSNSTQPKDRSIVGVVINQWLPICLNLFLIFLFICVSNISLPSVPLSFRAPGHIAISRSVMLNVSTVLSFPIPFVSSFLIHFNPSAYAIGVPSRERRQAWGFSRWSVLLTAWHFWNTLTMHEYVLWNLQRCIWTQQLHIPK